MLSIASKAAAIHLVGGLLLLLRVGVVGLAWSFLVAMFFSSWALLREASRACDVSALGLMGDLARRLLPALAACATLLSLIVYFAPPERWAGVIVTAAATGIAYTVAFYLGGVREEEILLARETLRLPALAARSTVRGLRSVLFFVVGFVRKRL